jgi:hypothetical protein
MNVTVVAKFEGSVILLRARPTGAEVKVDIKVVLAFPSYQESEHEATYAQRCHLLFFKALLPTMRWYFHPRKTGIRIQHKAGGMEMPLAVLDKFLFFLHVFPCLGR